MAARNEEVALTSALDAFDEGLSDEDAFTELELELEKELSETVDAKDAEDVDSFTRGAVIAGYMLVSSLLLIVNKLSVYYVDRAAVILFLQFAFSAIAAWGAGRLGVLECDKLEAAKLWAFVPAAMAQMGTIYTGMKAIQYSNVDTFIVFRASTPIALSVVDVLFLGREWPHLKSCCCLALMLLGTGIYVLTDHEFVAQMNGYMWIGIWYVTMVFDFAYLKHVVDNVPMSTCGRVLYQNLLGSIGFGCVAVGLGELEGLGGILEVLKPVAWFVLVGGCVLGAGMAGFSFALRSMTSSAQCCILGNMCKVLTVAINLLIWDKHASWPGIASLMLCLCAGYFYEQAPRRSEVVYEALPTTAEK